MVALGEVELVEESSGSEPGRTHTHSQQPVFVPIPGSPRAAATQRNPPIPPLGAAQRERRVSNRADRLRAFCLWRRAEQRAVFKGNGDIRMCERASDPAEWI